MTQWRPYQFWEYVGGLVGDFERDQMREMMAERGLSVLPQSSQESCMQGAVQYRRKDGGYGDRWITMAMFDGTLAAENYCSQQRKDNAWPFEYRAVELTDSRPDREGQ